MKNFGNQKVFGYQGRNTKGPNNQPDRWPPGEAHGVCSDTLPTQVHRHVLRFHAHSYPLGQTAKTILYSAGSNSDGILKIKTNMKYSKKKVPHNKQDQ